MAAVNSRAAARRLALRTGLLVTTPLIALGLALASAAPARAQTIWTGANPGNWFIGGNWSAGVPGGATQARIDSGNAVVGSPGAVSGTSYVGLGAGSAGAVTVDGAGSSWTSGGLAVGFAGSGMLTIRNGGTVTSSNAYVSGSTGGTGNVTVDGTGSTWATGSFIFVGNGNTGTLTIQNGGKVTSALSAIATNSPGSVTVDGAGSTWIISAGLTTVGQTKTGTLTISNGGQVSVGNTLAISGNVGSTGILNIGAASGQVAVAPGTLQAASLGFGAGTGRIVFNHTAADYVFAPPISGAGALRVEAGTTILTGANTYSGSTTISGGRLQLGSGATSGSITGNVTNNGTLAFNRSNAVSFSGVISGSGAFQQLGTGTTTLTGANTYSGGTTITSGTLQLGSGGTAGSITGNVVNNGTLAFSRSNAVTFGGIISGAGVVNQIGTGTTILTGANTYSGGTTIMSGTLQRGSGGTAGSITGGVTNNGTLAFNRSDALTFGGIISGAGGVNQIGIGTTILTGASTYTGATSVSGGTLRVNGSLVSAVTVGPGGTLGGSGTVGNTTINGGTLAPGNSIGTITVAGNLALTAAMTYLIEVNAAGQSDRTNVTGAATLGGSVQVIAAPGSYVPYRTYTILNAAGGRSGTFSGVNANFAFLTPSLSYDANNVFLTLEQTVALASAAQTPSQLATAAAVQSLGSFNPVYGAAVTLATADQARAAFDALSGEVHASTAGVLTEDSRYVRNAVLGRLRQAPFDGGPMASLAMGGPMLAYAADLPAKAAPFTSPPASTLTFWTQGFGAWGTFNGGGNAATIDRRLGGAIVGVDARPGNGWQLGFAAGFSEARMNVSARQSSATVDSGHVAVYGGKSFGAFNLRVGAAYAQHRIDTTRAIVFPGFADRATANYDGGTTQVFGEIGYGLARGNVAIEPFAGLAWVQARTNRFTETGGPAALAGLSNTEQTGTSTLGTRFATTFALTNGMALVPRVSAAWQHAFDDVTPAAALAFASGGPDFNIAGVPLAQDSALVEAGVDLRITAKATLGVSYLGQFASAVDDHAVKGKLAWNF